MKAPTVLVMGLSALILAGSASGEDEAKPEIIKRSGSPIE